MGQFHPRHAIIALVSAILIGCPLPFEFSGEGAGETERDPASPDVTSPVTFAFAQSGGGSGILADGGTLVSGVDTTITLSTETPNAVIYYTTNGGLTDLNAATRINASSGSFVVSRTTNLEQRTITAIAVGPNMRPSPEVAVSVDVSPFPILSVLSVPSSISEDGGEGMFIITSNIPPNNDLAVTVTTGGDYTLDQVDLSGPAPQGWTGGGPDTDDTIVFPAGQTSISIPVIGKPTTANESAEIELAIGESANDDYSVGHQNPGRIVIADNNTPILTFGVDVTDIDDDDTDTATFTVGASVAPTSDVILRFTTSGTYDAGDLNEIPGPADDNEQTFTRILPAGQESMTFSITAGADLGDYGPETVIVELLNDDAYELATNPSLHTVTINDSSTIADLEITVEPTSSVSDDGGEVTFTITATPAPEEVIEVTLLTEGDYEPGDFVSDPITIPQVDDDANNPFTVTFPANTASRTITLTGQADAGGADYLDELVRLKLQNGTGAFANAYTIGAHSEAEVTFNDPSQIPELVFEPQSTAAADADSIRFLVGASNVAPEVDTQVEFLIVDGNYQPGDITLDAAGTDPIPGINGTFRVLLPADQVLTEFFLYGHSDIDDQDNQSVVLAMRNPPTDALYIRSNETPTIEFIDTPISEIYVDAENGENSVHRGTSADSALRTISYALELATDGMSVRVAPGVYNAAHDEQFPLVVPADVSLVGNVEERGAGAQPTIIDSTGPGGNLRAIEPRSSSIIAGFTVTSAGYAFYVDRLNVRIQDNTIRDAGSTAIYVVNGGNNLQIERNTIIQNSYGIYFPHSNSTAGGLIENNSIVDNYDVGLYFVGETNDTKVQFNTIVGNRIGVAFDRPGGDLGGGAAGSEGFNTFSCNIHADLWTSSSIFIDAQNNYWDHAPPEQYIVDPLADPPQPPQPDGIDIRIRVTTEGVNSNGYQLADNPCDP